MKTKLGFIIIDNDKETATKRVHQFSMGMPEEQVREFVAFGTPEDVLKQIDSLEEAGIEYLIIDLEPSRELEGLEIFAESILKKKKSGITSSAS